MKKVDTLRVWASQPFSPKEPGVQPATLQDLPGPSRTLRVLAVTLDFPVRSRAVQRLHGWRGDGPLIVRTDHVQEHLVALFAVRFARLGELLVLCGGRSVWGETIDIKAALGHFSAEAFKRKDWPISESIYQKESFSINRFILFHICSTFARQHFGSTV